VKIYSQHSQRWHFTQPQKYSMILSSHKVPSWAVSSLSWAILSSTWILSIISISESELYMSEFSSIGYIVFLVLLFLAHLKTDSSWDLRVWHGNYIFPNVGWPFHS
jgi:hypothetical protein